MCTVVLLVRLAGSEAVNVYRCTLDHTGSTSQCSQQSAGGWTWQVAMNNGADNLVELARWQNDPLLPTGYVQHGVADGQGGGGQE